MILSRHAEIVRDEVLGEAFIVYRERRVGQGLYPRDPSTRDLPHNESHFCRRSSMFAIIFPIYDPFRGCTEFISRPGLRLSDFEFDFRGQCSEIWPDH